MSELLVRWLALVLYCLSMAGFLVFLFRRNQKAAQTANRLIGLGFAFHSLSLLIRTIGLGQLPVLNFSEALGFFGWCLVGAYLLLYWRFRLLVLGAFLSPLAVAAVLAGLLFPAKSLVVGPVYRSLWLTFHLGAVFAGYGFFALAFVAGVMYLIQERQIKSKRPGPVYHRLPSLSVLDRINYYCLAVGFPLMSLGIISGALYAQAALGRYWRWDPKEVWSLILWLVYAALLHQRLTVGWRGRRAAVMSIVGFSILCFTFLGVSFLMPGYHSFENLQRLQTP